MRLPITTALLVLLATGPVGAQILGGQTAGHALGGPGSSRLYVPGDHPTLTAAVSAANPGTTIIVTTAALQAPVVLDKELTIIGDPVANVGTEDLCSGAQFPAIRLAGPGSGKVVLSQLNLVQCFDAPEMAALLGGGGFSEVHVYDSTIVTSLTGLSGLGLGAPAISVAVPFLLLSGSAVLGGRDDVNTCWVGGFPVFLPPLQAYPGVESPGGQVAVLDSFVVGGSHNFQCCKFCGCPIDLEKIAGPGGAGIVAAEVLTAGSTVVGGSGAVVYAGQQHCGSTPNGPDFVAASVVALPGLIAGSGPMRLGSTWTLSYYAPGSTAALIFSLGVSAPVQIPGQGWSFFSPPMLFLGAVATGVPSSISMPIPVDAWLLGLEVNFQLLDNSIGLSRPVLEVLLP